MKKHIELLGILHLVYSGLGLIMGIVVFLVLSGAGWLSQDPTAMSILGLIAVVVAGFFVTLSVPGIVAGAGLIKMKPWSRILAIIMGVLHLINVPFGTALGVYTLWVLLNDEAVRLLSGTQPTVVVQNQ